MLFNKISIFDGGMGSMIEALGLDVTNVEDLNITNPLDIQKIHLSYALNGADYITTGEAINIVRTWIATEFEGGRHQERLNLVAEIESENMK